MYSYDIKKLHLYALYGFIGALIFVIGDLMLYISPNFNMEIYSQLDWINMDNWRFIVSIWCGILGMPLLIYGMYSIYKMLQVKYSNKLSNIFWISSLIGSASTSFLHFVLGCMEPLLYKQMIANGVEKETAKSIITNYISHLETPILVLLTLLIIIPTTIIIYAIIKGRLGLPKWMILLNPVFTVVLGSLISMLPIWNGVKGIFGAFESLGESLMYLIPLYYWKYIK